METLTAEQRELVESHLPLVRHVAFQVGVRFPAHVDREELVRAGSLGLVEAVCRWDQSRGVPFHRFASQRIRGAILDSVRADDWAPRSVRASGREVDLRARLLHGELGRVPTPGELAEALGISAESLRVLQSKIANSRLIALDRVASHDGDGDDARTLADGVVDASLQPDEAVAHADLLRRVRAAVLALPVRQQQVIAGYFLEERTSAEVAEELGVTESRVSQLRSQALSTLRAALLPADEAQPRKATNEGRESRLPALSTAR